MNYCCENNERVFRNSCSCCVNNKALIVSAIVALLILNCVGEECAETISAFMQSTGELIGTGLTRGCCCR